VRSLLLVLTAIEDTKTSAFVRMVLEGAGHRVVAAAGESQAVSLLSNGLAPDLVLCDISGAGSSEVVHYQSFLKWIPAEIIVLVGGVSEQASRGEALAVGIEHFLSRPVTRFDLDNLIDLVSRSDRQFAVRDCAASLAEKRTASAASRVEEALRITEEMPPAPCVEELGGNSFFLAASPKMLEILRQVNLIADIDVNVLILGESGTGKEVIAQLIHRNSRRAREKFLKVNCAALPAELLESELFGHRQGAFTGAVNDRPGKFEQANRGTLLLDEIGEIGVQMQAKLLHVLQDGQFARLGAQQSTKVDVRVLAATNVPIEDALLNGVFREDLYYRLSVFTIKVPPLRERREEIPYLIEQFIRRTPAEMKNGLSSHFPSRLMDAALLYDWRGNLRELRNFVTRTIVMRDPDAAARELETAIEASGVSDPVERSAGTIPPCGGIRSVVRDVKDRTEIEMIHNALDVCGWNRRRAAQYLSMSYRTLLYKIKQHHLRPRPAGMVDQTFTAARSSRYNTY
jgi:two-component system, NtrC family, response regulator AtoC